MAQNKRLQQYGIIISTIPYRQAQANIDRKHSTKILLCSSEEEHSASILRLGRELLVEGSGPFFNMRISQGSYWVRNLGGLHVGVFQTYARANIKWAGHRGYRVSLNTST